MDIFKTEADERIAELTAQVERLREAMDKIREIDPTERLEYQAGLTLIIIAEALDETPEQSLAEIEAAAIEAALKESTFLGPDGGEYISVDDLQNYADYLRTTNKSGGGDAR